MPAAAYTIRLPRRSTPGEAKPFVKWVGGKRQLLVELVKHAPKSFGTYHEPFLGGGALFFALRPENAVLSDLNERLVRTWRGVQGDVEGVIARLAEYRNDEAFFYEMRARDIDAESDTELAAWFIYLNKTGYNGLYRVNSKNRMNVPFGRYARPAICDEHTLRACAEALRGVELRHERYDAVLDRAIAGDFVYFDPPYVPLSATASFTGYVANGFGPDEQQHLRDVARELKARGVRVLLSNSSARAVRELYRGFRIVEVQATRAVNSVASGRGKIAELLIR